MATEESNVDVKNNSALGPDEKENAVAPFEHSKLSEEGTKSDDNKQKPEQRSVTGVKWFFAYTSILSTVLLFALDGTIVANLQPAIVSAFQTEQNLAWIGVSFMLGNTTILTLGKAFGVFNMKWLFIINLILFEVGSALCGAAPNMPALIVGRVIAGVGGCGIYAGGLTYVSVLTTNHERPLYLAGIYCIWGVGCVLGPIVGGSFAQSAATWRWGFYINLPIAALFAPAYLFCLPSLDAMTGTPFVQKLRKVDWIATVVFLAGCTCFTMAINFGGTVYAFSSGSFIALWVMTVVLLISFILVTIYHPGVSSEDKLLPVQFMRTADLIILPIEAFLSAAAMFVAIYYTPLVFQFTRGDGPLDAGVRLLPLICTLVFFALLNGALLPKLGYYMPWYVLGNALVLIGASLMLTMNSLTPQGKIYGYSVLIGTGIGCFQSSGVAVVSSLAPPSDVNNAVSIMTIAQVLGGAVSLSVTGAIFGNLAVQRIASVLPGTSPEAIGHMITGTSSSQFRDLSDILKAKVIEQVTDTIKDTFAFLVASAALGFVLSLFLGRKQLYLAGGQVANTNQP